MIAWKRTQGIGEAYEGTKQVSRGLLDSILASSRLVGIRIARHAKLGALLTIRDIEGKDFKKVTRRGLRDVKLGMGRIRCIKSIDFQQHDVEISMLQGIEYTLFQPVDVQADIITIHAFQFVIFG